MFEELLVITVAVGSARTDSIFQQARSKSEKAISGARISRTLYIEWRCSSSLAARKFSEK